MATIFGKKSTGASKSTSAWNLGIDVGSIGLGTGKSSSSGSSSSGSKASDASVLSGYIDEMYELFSPEEIVYEAKTEEELSASIAEWLRPGYDQAIANRQTQTLTYQAETDADAIARGMGSSTYVTDVKARQSREEASDIATLESDYGSTLAKYVSEGVESETERALEVQMYNAERRQEAYELAYSAAIELFKYYKKSGSSGGSGSKTVTTVATTTAENCDTFLSLLSGDERKAVYNASTEESAQYRDEILASVGYSGYLSLRKKYPESP